MNIIKAIGASGALLSFAASAQATSCEAVKDIVLQDAKVVVAEPVQAGLYTGDRDVFSMWFKSGQAAPEQVPAFCRVVAIARPSRDSDITFEVWMPKENWDGRYYQVGNGGDSGYIDYRALASGLRKGHAVVNTDDGRPKIDGNSWWQFHPEKVKDHVWRGQKVTSDLARKVVAAYYGKPATHHYYTDW